jgi:peptide chain release factor 1
LSESLRFALIHSNLAHWALSAERTMKTTLFLEIHAASGGADAARFAASLAQAYLRAASARGWRYEVLEQQGSPEQLRRVLMRFVGSGVEVLTGEAGAHRVIRLARDNTRHTSIVTVAVLPAASAEIPIAASELRVELMRASGHGGQNINKRETAVRITHLPSGISAHIADERYQGRNKAAALELINSRVAAARKTVSNARNDLARAKQLGSGDFAERRRSYAEREGTVTDHASGKKARLGDVLAGDFTAFWD